MAIRKTCRCGNAQPCAEHQRQRPERNGAAHKRARAQTLREEKRCWLCLAPAWPDDVNPETGRRDPLTADHVIPRALGGQDTRRNYRAAHASCNSRRGAKTLA